ncbi:MAG: hypothetical protein WD076_06635, partial [Parvularculaceae bacterium]
YLQSERAVVARLSEDPAYKEQITAPSPPTARAAPASDPAAQPAAATSAPDQPSATRRPLQQGEAMAPAAAPVPAPAATAGPLRAPESTPRRPNEVALPAPITRSGVGVIVVGAGGAPEPTIASIKGAAPVVFIAQYPDEEAVAAARQAGVAVAAFADQALSPGRARNAGYRQAAKARPGLAYVQFVECGVVLDPGWLDAAQKFMDRRPEVVAVEGVDSNAAALRAGLGGGAVEESGEITATGPTALVRADAFEAIGGFRGDLPVNETVDLCIRFRRRGGHIWRIDAPMGTRAVAPRGLGGWWSARSRAGFEFAHGAALHGGSPEGLYKRERSRALFWGGFLPGFIVTAAVVSAAVARLVWPAAPSWPAFVSALGAGAMIYILRIVVLAVRGGGGPRAWAQAATSTVACAPEFLGAWRYYFGGARARRQTSAMA